MALHKPSTGWLFWEEAARMVGKTRGWLSLAHKDGKVRRQKNEQAGVYEYCQEDLEKYRVLDGEVRGKHREPKSTHPVIDKVMMLMDGYKDNVLTREAVVAMLKRTFS
jgi:hypothetical protein